MKSPWHQWDDDRLNRASSILMRIVALSAAAGLTLLTVGLLYDILFSCGLVFVFSFCISVWTELSLWKELRDRSHKRLSEAIDKLIENLESDD